MDGFLDIFERSTNVAIVALFVWFLKSHDHTLRSALQMIIELPHLVAELKTVTQLLRKVSDMIVSEQEASSKSSSEE